MQRQLGVDVQGRCSATQGDGDGGRVDGSRNTRARVQVVKAGDVAQKLNDCFEKQGIAARGCGGLDSGSAAG